MAATLAIFLVLLSLGCASPARTGAMVPLQEERHPARTIRSVDVQTYGGQETSPLGRSRISNSAFTDALATALEDSGALYAVADRPGEYHLDVAIDELRQPYFAFAMTVHLVTTWDLTRHGESDPVWRDIISTTYTAPFEVEFFGIERLRLATEGAMRQSIAWAVDELLPYID